MIRKVGFFALLALFVGLTAPHASAAVTADFLMKTDSSKSAPNRGKYYIDHDAKRMRIDMTVGESSTASKISSIIDLEHRKAFTLLHQQKQVMSVSFEDAKKDSPWLGSGFDRKSMETEARNQGWNVRVIGKETLEGYSCEIWEMTRTKKSGTGGAEKILAWLAPDLNYNPALRTVASGPDGKVELSLANIKKGNIDPALFEVPKGYTPFQMANMNAAGAGSISPKKAGCTPASMEEMMRIAQDTQMSPEKKQAAIRKMSCQ